MGVIQMFNDWRMVKKEKEGLLAALQMTPPGAAISVKNPSNPITARALIELLRDHPDTLEMMDYGFEVTIMRKIGMVKSMSTDSYQHLKSKHHILHADSLLALNLKNDHKLPAHPLRDGVPDGYNGPGEE